MYTNENMTEIDIQLFKLLDTIVKNQETTQNTIEKMDDDIATSRYVQYFFRGLVIYLLIYICVKCKTIMSFNSISTVSPSTSIATQIVNNENTPRENLESENREMNEVV